MPKCHLYFNPRSPCGERLPCIIADDLNTAFQSTLPVRGATTWHRKIMAMRRFQSTLPVRGATYRHVPNHRPEPYFNPRSPCGERPPPWSCLSGQRTDFNPRSPCGERPDNWRGGLTWVGISIHAPRAGSDGLIERRINRYKYFNPRSPCGERRFV